MQRGTGQGKGGGGDSSSNGDGDGSSGMSVEKLPLVVGGFTGPGGAGPASCDDGNSGSDGSGSGSSNSTGLGMCTGIGVGMGVPAEVAEVGPLGQLRPMGQPVREVREQWEQQPWVAPGSGDKGEREVPTASAWHVEQRMERAARATAIMCVAAATALAMEVGVEAKEEEADVGYELSKGGTKGACHLTTVGGTKQITLPLLRQVR